MSQLNDHATLKCEIKVARLANFHLDLPVAGGILFVRCYVYAGGGRRIRIDTREVTAAAVSSPSWDDLASLECRGPSDVIRQLLETKLVFELRWRKTAAATSFLGRAAGSKLLGRAEVAWRDVLESSGRSPERWITFTAASRELRAIGLPLLLVEMRAQVVEEPLKRKKIGRGMEMEGCDCKYCAWSLTEEDMFQAATFFTP